MMNRLLRPVSHSAGLGRKRPFQVVGCQKAVTSPTSADPSAFLPLDESFSTSYSALMLGIRSDTMALMSSDLLERARREARLTQNELARMAGTSRPTLSAYERGRKSPSLDTVLRVLEAAGFSLELAPSIHWSKVLGARGQVHFVPDRLFRLRLAQALAQFQAPLHLEWSKTNRSVDLTNRSQRLRWYELVLREGSVNDIQAFIDGALLIDAWPDLVVPRAIRAAWQSLVDQYAAGQS